MIIAIHFCMVSPTLTSQVEISFDLLLWLYGCMSVCVSHMSRLILESELLLGGEFVNSGEAIRALGPQIIKRVHGLCSDVFNG